MRKSAFTLVELLIVIAIIAVLMAILMPALRAAKDHAHRIHCMNNLKTLSLAWYLYMDDNDGKLVGGNPRDGDPKEWPWVRTPRGPVDPGDPTAREKEGIRQGALFPYVKELDVYRCPADSRKKIPGKETFGSYSIPGGANGEESSGSVRAKYDSDIRNPAIKYVFVEECDPRGVNVGSWIMMFGPPKWIDPFANWHGNRSCLGFADGHAAEMHRWEDDSTLEMCKLAADMDTGAFRYPIPGDEGKDVEFMARGYPCKSHD